MNLRQEVLVAVAEGRLSVQDAALTLDVPEAVLTQQVATVRALQRHVTKRRWRAAGLLAAVGVAMGVGTSVAAGPCAQTLPAPLVTFCADSPAIAAEVNDNFLAVWNLVTTKLGNAPGNGITTGAVTTSTVTTGTVASSGGVTVTGGGVTVSAGGVAVNGGNLAVNSGSLTVSNGGTISNGLTVNGALQVNGAASVTGALASGCPTTFPIGGGAVNMVDMGAYCIQFEYDANNGRNAKTWLQTAEYCIQRGLRLCSLSEVSVAMRLSRIRTYDFVAQGDYWAWIDQTATDNNNYGFGGCHVNLNTNRGSVLLGESNCAIDANSTTGSIGGLCCL